MGGGGRKSPVGGRRPPMPSPGYATRPTDWWSRFCRLLEVNHFPCWKSPSATLPFRPRVRPVERANWDNGVEIEENPADIK